MTDDDRAREGVEHVQAAAKELFAAARAMLDVVEKLVDDPAAVPTLLASLGSVARAAGSGWPFANPGAGGARSAADEPGGPGEPGEPGEPGPDGIERIPVS